MDLELKIHDARRKIEKLLGINRAGQSLPDNELEALASDLVESLQHFYDIRNGTEKVTDEIETEAKSNVVDIFPKGDK